MRAVVQRVSRASVRVDGQVTGAIDEGLLVFLGVRRGDTRQDADYLAGKTVGLRIFSDSQGKMNRSLVDSGGGLLVISQFTLYGDCRRGRRPSFDVAASPEEARALYDYFVSAVLKHDVPTATGVFQASMEVELVNDGPVTILLDSAKLF